MDIPYFQVYHLSESQLGALIKDKVREALQETHQVKLMRSVEIEKAELRTALQLTRLEFVQTL